IEQYNFECEAGNLINCVDWQELKKELHPLLPQASVTCRVGVKCLANFGEGEVLRNCTVIDVTEDGFTVEADGLGWKMGPIPLAKFRPAHAGNVSHIAVRWRFRSNKLSINNKI